MGDNSKIEWTEASWNPVTGCVKVSPGCDNCYAETFAERFRGVAGHHFEQGFDVVLRPERLGQPLRWTRPRRIFVNSMSDLFHDAVPDSFIAQVWAVMAATPQHTYQILTKRHGRMKAFLNDICRCGSGHPPGTHLMSAIQWAATPHNPSYVPGLDHDTVQEAIRGMTWGKVLPNVWLGVSVEDQKWADVRIPALLETPAAVRWISAEPLLGPVDLLPFVSHQCDCPLLPDHLRLSEYGPRLDWVVAGGESGRGARPMHPDWARGLRDQCAHAGVPFFFKQAGAVLARDWGCSDRKGHNPSEWPEPFPREYPNA